MDTEQYITLQTTISGPARWFNVDAKIVLRCKSAVVQPEPSFVLEFETYGLGRTGSVDVDAFTRVLSALAALQAHLAVLEEFEQEDGTSLYWENSGVNVRLRRKKSFSGFAKIDATIAVGEFRVERELSDGLVQEFARVQQQIDELAAAFTRRMQAHGGAKSALPGAG